MLFRTLGLVLLMSNASPTVRHIGQISEIPDAKPALCQAFNKVYTSNGHCRIHVWDGQVFRPAGLRGPLKAPVVTGTAGGGSVVGIWRFGTQFWHKRGAASNISPLSVPTAKLTGKTVSISLNLDSTFDYRDLADDPKNGLVAIWAYRQGTDELKVVGRIPLSQSTYQFDMTGEEFDAILALDRVANPIGSLSEPISIGNDVPPTGQFLAEYAGRLWIFGQLDYTHPGSVTIVPKDKLEEYFSGLTSVQIGEIFGPGARTYFDAFGAAGLAGIYENYSGAPRTMVVLDPEGSDETEAVFWAHSDQTKILVGPNRTYLRIVIHGRTVAYFRAGTWDAAADEGSGWNIDIAGFEGTFGVFPSVSSIVEWDANGDAITFNIRKGVGGPWQPAFKIDSFGDLIYYGNPLRPNGATKHYLSASQDDPIQEDYVVDSWLCFLAQGYPGTGLVSPLFYHWTSGGQEYFRYNTLTENVDPASLSYPTFQLGLLYKKFFDRGEFKGFVYDVVGPRVLWLDRDVGGEIQYAVQDWRIEGLPFLFYTGVGNPEGAYVGVSVRTEGRGTYFYSQFFSSSEDAGMEGRTPAGLYVTSDGLHVVFEEAEYLLQVNSAATPIPPGAYRIDRKRTQVSVLAPRSVAAGTQGERYAVTTRPLNVAKILGGRSEPMLDAMAARGVLTERVERNSLRDAYGAYWTDDQNSAYMVGNMTKKGGAGLVDGEHSLLIELRNEPRVVSIDGMTATALTPWKTSDGTQRLVYADADGNVGVMFEDVLDEATEGTGRAIPWAYRVYLATPGLERVALTRARLFGRREIDAQYTVQLRVWAVGADAPDSRLIEDQPSYPGFGMNFTESDVRAGLWMPARALDSTALLLELSGQQAFRVELQFLDIKYVVFEEAGR